MKYICPAAKKCGGCQLSNLIYDDQLALKQSKIIRAVGRYCRVDEIIGMDDPFHYRNKATHIFGFKRGNIVSGIYQSATRRITPIDDCMIEDKYSNLLVKTIKELCVSFKIKAYDIDSRRGFVRHVLVRKSKNTGEIMVVIVTAKGEFPKKRDFVKALLEKHPDITTVVWNINPTEIPIYLGEKNEVFFGDGYITDRLCGLSFRISPNSFYQVNSVQTEVLYNKVKEFASLCGKEKVIDAYCGTGTIGLSLAKSAKEIIGVELNASAVKDACFNAELNGIKNTKFVCADAGEFMLAQAQKGEKIDVVITDPPRSGCSKRFLESLLSLLPERVVYVSCNPETLSRDLFTLRKGGYRVTKIQPVDMFPHTEHIEAVCLLSKK